MIEEVRDIAPPGEEIVDAKDFVALGQQPLAEVRAEKPSSPGDQHATPLLHRGVLRRLIWPGSTTRRLAV